MESGGQKGVLSHCITPSPLQPQQIELYLEFATQLEEAYFTTSGRGRKIFLLAWQQTSQ